MSALTGTKLFARSLNLTVAAVDSPQTLVQATFNEGNGFDLSSLSVEFVVEKSLKATEPNTCQIRVMNLAPATRQSLSGESKLAVRLEAGYIGGTSQLYFSEARSAWTTREGATFVTHIESTDTIARPTGVRKTKKIQPGSQTGTLYRTMGARVPLKEAFRAITKALGIDEGNLEAALANASGAPLTDVGGGALTGNGARRMTDLCRSAGLEWSIQDGALQLLNIGETLSTTKAIELNSGTGLINSPSVDSKGALSLTTLLIPGLAPGVLIKVDSEFVSGGYRIEKIRYTGHTQGQEWYAHIEAARY